MRAFLRFPASWSRGGCAGAPRRSSPCSPRSSRILMFRPQPAEPPGPLSGIGWRDHVANEERAMLEGLVQQDFPLTIGYVVDRLRTVNGGGEIVSSTGEGTERARYDEVAARVDRLCAALRDLGVREGDRVATLAWNHQRHFECYLAIPAMGAVLHTLNLRFFPDQLAYIANHAEDSIVFLDDSLVELWEKVVPQLETVRHNVLMGDGDGGSLPNLIRYEDLLAGQDDGF